MNCPRCNSVLSTTTVHDVDVETCPKCGGMFLDRGVLDRIAEPHEGDLEFSSLDRETFSHDDAHGATGCLRCDGQTMKKVEFNIYTGIILDYCEHCRAFCSCVVIDRTMAMCLACPASFGRCSEMRMPGTEVAIAWNVPPFGLFGFKSNVSI